MSAPRPSAPGPLARLLALGRGLLGRRFARVAYAGATSAAVDFAVFNALMLGLDHERTLHVLSANSAAFGCAMVVNYAMNARFSFGVRPSRRSAVAYIVFTAFGLAFYNLNLFWIREALDAVSPLMLNVSKVAAMGLLVVWNFFGYQRFVFGPDTRAAAMPDRAPRGERADGGDR